MALGKVVSLTLKTIDDRGRLLDSPQVTAEVSLIIEVPIPYGRGGRKNSDSALSGIPA